jgi:hypothetical protein
METGHSEMTLQTTKHNRALDPEAQCLWGEAVLPKTNTLRSKSTIIIYKNNSTPSNHHRAYIGLPHSKSHAIVLIRVASIPISLLLRVPGSLMNKEVIAHNANRNLISSREDIIVENVDSKLLTQY